MQVFRLMDMPDRVIAFNELPERFLSGFEMCRAEGFPRHWKEFLGKRKKVTAIPPEKDLLTGQVRRFDPIIEEDAFFYLVDYTLNPCEEAWKEVCDYVRQNVDRNIRLMEKIDDMAVPLATNKSDGVTLEPEEVPIITLPKEIPSLVDAKGNEPIKKGTEFKIKCDEKDCIAEFASKQAVRMHKMKKHRKEAVTI